MIITTLDIETTVNSKLWTEYKSEKPNVSFAPLPLHNPCVIVWLTVDERSLYFDLNVRSARSKGWEKQCLEDLAKACIESHRIVTFNGRNFDMPLLGIRAIKFGVDWSWWLDSRHRFKGYNYDLIHYDLADQIADYSYNNCRLDHLLRAMGKKGKVDIKGKDVDALWKSKKRRNRNKIETYCQQDVYQTFWLYLKWRRSIEGKPNTHIVRALEKWARTIKALKPLFD